MWVELLPPGATAPALLGALETPAEAQHWPSVASGHWLGHLTHPDVRHHLILNTTVIIDPFYR